MLKPLYSSSGKTTETINSLENQCNLTGPEKDTTIKNSPKLVEDEDKDL